MGYDLLIAGRGETRIMTLPFYWLARLLAAPFFWGGGIRYFSITRGRHDIIWRREIITDRELARRTGKGERPRAVKIGSDRWEVLRDSDTHR